MFLHPRSVFFSSYRHHLYVHSFPTRRSSDLGKDVNSHTVLDGIITTIMATIQRINIIGSREGSRNRRRLKANQTGKKFRVGIKSNISTNRNNLILLLDRKSGSAGMPRPISYAVFCLKKKKKKKKKNTM